MAEFDGLLFGTLYWVAQGLTLWAFVDAVIRPAILAALPEVKSFNIGATGCD